MTTMTKDKQSTCISILHYTQDKATWSPLKTRGELITHVTEYTTRKFNEKLKWYKKILIKTTTKNNKKQTIEATKQLHQNNSNIGPHHLFKFNWIRFFNNNCFINI